MTRTTGSGALLPPLGPESLTWRLGFPRTALLLAGRALMLQVAHPVVGAGVRDFSRFAEDPYGRLDSTLVSLNVQLFGGEQVYAEAERLQTMHVPIRGTGFDGSPYSALMPEAFAWVPVTNFDSFVELRRLFGRPLTADQQQQLWTEHRRTALILGGKERYLPESLADLHVWQEQMLADRLDDNETCQKVLHTLELRDVPSPLWLLPDPLWRAIRPLGRQVIRDATVWSLPPIMREKLGITGDRFSRKRFEALAAVVHQVAPLVPDRLLHYPLAYRAMEASRRHRREHAAG